MVIFLVQFSFNIRSNTSDSSNCQLVGACQKWEPVRLAEKVILGIFLSFSLKAANYYPAYHIRPNFSKFKVRALWNSVHENVL